jgi:hypothetical protein
VLRKHRVFPFRVVAKVALVLSLLLQSAVAGINVGVKTGDWIKYDYYDQRQGAVEPHFWLELTVTSVNGTIVSFHPVSNSTLQGFNDGHVDIAYNCFAYLVSAPIVPTNLSAGDAVLTGAIYVTINDTTQFAGREAAHLELSGSLGSDEWYWDRETGVLLAYSTLGGTQFMRVAETSLFTIVPEFSSLPFLLFFLIIVSSAIALCRQKTALGTKSRNEVNRDP